MIKVVEIVEEPSTGVTLTVNDKSIEITQNDLVNSKQGDEWNISFTKSNNIHTSTAKVVFREAYTIVVLFTEEFINPDNNTYEYKKIMKGFDLII